MFAFQDKDEHLQLMDGMLVDLLNAKWNAFVKFRYSAHLLLEYCIKLAVIPVVVKTDFIPQLLHFIEHSMFIDINILY
jgi:hypothetical protein